MGGPDGKIFGPRSWRTGTEHNLPTTFPPHLVGEFDVYDVGKFSSAPITVFSIISKRRCHLGGKLNEGELTLLLDQVPMTVHLIMSRRLKVSVKKKYNT